MVNDSRNIIQHRTFEFALMVIQVYKEMVEKKEFVLSKQLVRSGTSIGANVEEAMAAISKKDFIHKMSVSSKEARETRYWLKLIEASKLINADIKQCLLEVEEIVRILTAIVKTSQKNMQNEAR